MASDMTDNESKSAPKRTSVAKAMIVGILTGFVCGSMFVYAVNTRHYGARIKSLDEKNTELRNQICEWQSKAHSYENTLQQFESQSPNSRIVPDDIIRMKSDMETFTQCWTSECDGHIYTVTYSINKNIYDWYKNCGYIWYESCGYVEFGSEEYSELVTEPQNVLVLDSIIAQFQSLSQQYGWGDWQFYQELITFVRTMGFYQISETRSCYPKCPLETLYDRNGNSEDVSCLLAGLLDRSNKGVAIIKYDDHTCAGLHVSNTWDGGTYYTVGDKRYCVVECLANCRVGELPSDFADAQVKSISVINRYSLIAH